MANRNFLVHTARLWSLRPAVLIACTCSVMTPWAIAQDFYYPPPSTVDTHVMSRSMENLRHQRESDKRLRSSSEPAARDSKQSSASSVDAQIENLVLNTLKSEAQRRVGQQSGEERNAWFMKAARDMGHRIGALRPEYNRRLATDASGADRWFQASAREQLSSYLRLGG